MASATVLMPLSSIPLVTAFLLPIFGKKGKAVATALANLATISFLARYHETSEVNSQAQADLAVHRAECFALRARIAPDKTARRVAGCLAITFRLEADAHQARVTRHTVCNGAVMVA